MVTADPVPEDGDKGKELTPEQCELHQTWYRNFYADAMPKLNFQVPNLAVDASGIAKIAAGVARLNRISMPESVIKGIGKGSVFAEQNARLVAGAKPILDSLTGWPQQFTPISSDLVKLVGVDQLKLNLLGELLIKSARFGWNDRLSEIVKLYATQQTNWLKSLAPSLDRLKDKFYPSNLRAIENVRLEDVEQVVMLDGIALYEVPRTEIARRLVTAPGSSARRDILGRKWREITTDCRTTLESCDSERVAPMVRFATDAIDALEAGSSTSAQSLVGSMVDTLLRKYLSKTKPLIVPSKGTRNADNYLHFSVRKYIALAPIWQAYQSYHPDNGDRVPRTFNRHATAHTVGNLQYSRRNAVQGLMLVCGLLKFIDEQESVQAAA